MSYQDYNRIPSWLSINRQYVPDFVVSDPKSAPVWEITGTEFSKAEAHTADGISIRFPRVTKIRFVINCIVLVFIMLSSSVFFLNLSGTIRIGKLQLTYLA